MACLFLIDKTCITTQNLGEKSKCKPGLINVVEYSLITNSLLSIYM